MPKELTPARSGPVPLFHSVFSVLTKNGPAAKSMSGLGSVKCRLGTRVRCSSISAVLIRPAMPAAVSRCPMLVFTEPSAQYPDRSVPSRKASVSAATSMGSPSGVPVPCAST